MNKQPALSAPNCHIFHTPFRRSKLYNPLNTDYLRFISHLPFGLNKNVLCSITKRLHLKADDPVPSKKSHRVFTEPTTTVNLSRGRLTNCDTYNSHYRSSATRFWSRKQNTSLHSACPAKLWNFNSSRLAGRQSSCDSSVERWNENSRYCFARGRTGRVRKRMR